MRSSFIFFLSAQLLICSALNGQTEWKNWNTAQLNLSFTKKLDLKLDINKLDREIKDIEGEIMKNTEQLSEVTKQIALKKFQKRFGKDIDYIG